MGKIILTVGAAPPQPEAGTVALYSKVDKNIYFQDDVGTETQLLGTELLLDVSPQLGGDLDRNGFDITADGVKVLSFATAIEPANWVDIVQGSDGGSPIVRAVGGNTDIDLRLDAKGTGSIQLDAPLNVNNNTVTDVTSFIDDGNIILSFTSGGESAVNWIDVKHSATGLGPTISSKGSDTDVDLNISAKGAGVVNLGSGGVKFNSPLDINNQTISGVASFNKGSGIALTLSPGTEVGANWVDVQWSETGQNPVIRVMGSDTNIDLKLETKGTGSIDVSSNNIINVGSPVSSSDAATKGYVDSGVGGDLGEFTVAGLPTASSYANAYALATNASSGRTIVRSDGTDWKVVVVEGATVTV